LREDSSGQMFVVISAATWNLPDGQGIGRPQSFSVNV